jgi:hypothetical protein
VLSIHKAVDPIPRTGRKGGKKIEKNREGMAGKSEFLLSYVSVD